MAIPPGRCERCEQWSEALELVFASDADRPQEVCPVCLAAMKDWRKMQGRFIEEEDPRR